MHGMNDMLANRMTCLYFVYNSLCLIGAQDQCIFTKDQIKEWVYQQQLKDGGFRGGPYMSFKNEEQNINDIPNIANTYCALCLLILCEDYKLERVNRKGLVNQLKKFQKENGCFMVLPIESETDMRFNYCACAISYILNDWSGIDTIKLKDFILNCQAYQGGFAWVPYGESHAGLTYCSLSSLSLMDYQFETESQKQRLIEFLVFRQQDGGFQGRCNKLCDSCYSFWNKASLDQLGQLHLINNKEDQKFILECFTKHGGFAKYNFVKKPDILHTFYSLAALSLSGFEGIQLINSILAIPQYHFNLLKSIQ